MKETNPDWCIVAKKLMYDIRTINSEIFTLESDTEKQQPISTVEYTSAMKMNTPSVASFQDTDCNDMKEHSFDFPDDWENVSSQLNFDMNDFELELQKNSSVKTGYEQESEYTSQTEGLPPTEPKEVNPPAKKRL